MKILAIETAVSPGSLAIAETSATGQATVETVELPRDQRSAQSLAPALAALLAEAGWKADAVDAVAVTTGPGSFTGLRIGVTTAKAFAYAAGARCVAINTHAVLSAQAAPGAEGWSVLDAQRREVFAARLSDPSRVSIVAEDDWLARLTPGETVTGPVLAKLAPRLPAGVLLSDESAWAPQAATVARLAIAAGDSQTPFELAPVYFRLSAAEEKLQSPG